MTQRCVQCSVDQVTCKALHRLFANEKLGSLDHLCDWIPRPKGQNTGPRSDDGLGGFAAPGRHTKQILRVHVSLRKLNTLPIKSLLHLSAEHSLAIYLFRTRCRKDYFIGI